MSPHRLAILHKRILFAFFATVGVLVFLTLDFGSSHRAASAAHDASMGDQLSPGFFNPPPGVQPINNVLPSRIPHARRSYAWRSHGNKRELVAFSTPIQHVVVIYMENRTPENLFGAWYGTTNPSTGNTFGTDLKLEDVSLVSPNAYFSPEPLTHGKDPAHNHNAAFVDEAAGSWPTAGDKSGYWYVPTSGASPSVSNYIALIENWAYENSTLESNEGPSFVAHQYAIAGQSGGLSNSNIAPNGMSENPAGGTGPDPGPGTCFTSTSQTEVALNMYSPYPNPSPTPAGYSPSPCVEYSTILDEMASAAPSSSPYDQWQYVAFDDRIIWAAPMTVSHLYNDYSSDPNPSKTGQPFAVDPDAENFVLNVSGSTSPTPNPPRPFAELTFLTPCLAESDHPNTAGPGGTSLDHGPDWLAYVLNAIGNSSYWNNTAVVVTWDDWGGFYDNFSPSPWPHHPLGNAYSPPGVGHGNLEDPNEWGFRVPLIVISPWVKSKGYISSTLISQGAILNFIETVFGVPSLNGDDKANGSNDLTNMLDLSSNTPLSWSSLPSNFSPANNDTCP